VYDAAFGWNGSTHPQFVQSHSASGSYEDIQIPLSHASPQPQDFIDLTSSAQPVVHVQQQQQQFHYQPQQSAYFSPFAPQQLGHASFGIQHPGGFQGVNPGFGMADATAFGGGFQTAAPNIYHPARSQGGQFVTGMPLNGYQNIPQTHYMAPNTQYVQHPLAQQIPLTQQHPMARYHPLSNPVVPTIPQRQRPRAIRHRHVASTPDRERAQVAQRGPVGAPISKPLGGHQIYKRFDVCAPDLQQPKSPETIQQQNIHQSNPLHESRHPHTRKQRPVQRYFLKPGTMSSQTNISKLVSPVLDRSVPLKDPEGVQSREPVAHEPPCSPKTIEPQVTYTPHQPKAATTENIQPHHAINQGLVDAMMTLDDSGSVDPTLRIHGAMHPTEQLLEAYNMRGLLEELVEETEKYTMRQSAEWEAERLVKLGEQEGGERKGSSV
jgi:hypothetical protein